MINFMQLLPLFNQFRSNPSAFLASRNLNIPPQYMSSPETAAKYLMQSNNMNQSGINSMMQTANEFMNFMGTNNNNPR